jgi:hypothetical protein
LATDTFSPFAGREEWSMAEVFPIPSSQSGIPDMQQYLPIYHFFSVFVGEDGVLTVFGSWTTTNRPVFRHSKTLGSVMPWGGIHGEPSVLPNGYFSGPRLFFSFDLLVKYVDRFADRGAAGAASLIDGQASR